MLKKAIKKSGRVGRKKSGVVQRCVLLYGQWTSERRIGMSHDRKRLCIQGLLHDLFAARRSGVNHKIDGPALHRQAALQLQAIGGPP
ncbi:MAG TPA: hypothetical protein PKZ53_17480, partial [Acidobacteriota bacterium]|nr:hypothetical protein [Acidobacteriota bacterium]